MSGAFSHSNEGRQHLCNQVELATYGWVFIEYSQKGRFHDRVKPLQLTSEQIDDVWSIRPPQHFHAKPENTGL